MNIVVLWWLNLALLYKCLIIAGAFVVMALLLLVVEADKDNYEAKNLAKWPEDDYLDMGMEERISPTIEEE